MEQGLPWDLTELVRQLISPFGYSVQPRSNRRYFAKQIAFTVLIWIDWLYSVATVSIDDPWLLSATSEIGYAAFGFRFRYVASGIANFFKLLLPLLQSVYIFDDHQWLRRANWHYQRLQHHVQIDHSLTRLIRPLK